MDFFKRSTSLLLSVLLIFSSVSGGFAQATSAQTSTHSASTLFQHEALVPVLTTLTSPQLRATARTYIGSIYLQAQELVFQFKDRQAYYDVVSRVQPKRLVLYSGWITIATAAIFHFGFGVPSPQLNSTEVLHTFIHVMTFSLLTSLVWGLFGKLTDKPGQLLGCGLTTLSAGGYGKNPEKYLPYYRAINAAQNEMTVRRGIHQAGAFITIHFVDEAGYSHKVFRWVKEVGFKREPLASVMTDKSYSLVEKEVENARAKHPDWEFVDFAVKIHFRYSTGGDPTIPQEAQPHFGEPKRKAKIMRWSPDGKTRLVLEEEAQTVSGYNGDGRTFGFDWLGGKRFSVGEIKSKLGALFGMNINLLGDNVANALYISLLRAKDDPYAALRLGFQKAKGQYTRTELSDPSSTVLDQWTRTFLKVVEPYEAGVSFYQPGSRELKPLNDAVFAKFKRELEKAFHDDYDVTKANPQSMLQQQSYLMDRFLEEAIHAYLQNDLFHVMQLFDANVEGTFGMHPISTLEDTTVVYTSGQPVSLLLNHEHGVTSVVSESLIAGLQVQNASGAYEYAFDEMIMLDQWNREIAMHDPVSGKTVIYSGSSKKFLHEADQVAFAKRHVNIDDSSYIQPIRLETESRPAQVELERVAQVLDAVNTSWASENKDSLNQDTSAALGDALLTLWKAKRKGITHLALVAFDREYEMMVRWQDQLRDWFPELTVELIQANEFLIKGEKALKNHRIAPETVVLAMNRPGQDFPALFASSFLTRYVKNLFVITGGVDGNLNSKLAQAVGQELHAGADFSRRVITTNSPYPLSMAVGSDYPAAVQTLNYLRIHLAEQFIQKTKRGAFGLTIQSDDLSWARDALRYQLPVAISQITGVDEKGFQVKSPVSDSIRQFARKEAQNFTEMRTVKYVTRLVSYLTIALMLHQLFSPHSLFGTTISSVGFIAALVDVVYFNIIDKVVFGILRTAQKRQLFSRNVGRTIGVANYSMWFEMERYFNMLFGLGYPDIGVAGVRGGSTASGTREFLVSHGGAFQRGDRLWTFQSDDRLMSGEQQNIIEATRMTAGQMMANTRSMPFAKWVNLLSNALQKIGLPRIPFAHTEVITFGRSFPMGGSNVSYPVHLPTTSFPLPPAVQAFMKEVSHQTGHIFTINDGANLFKELWSRFELLENEQTHFLKEGKAIAQAIGLDARYHDKFAQLFDAQHESLLRLSAEDLRRQHVLETFLAEAILPVEGFVAQAVAAEEVQYRVAYQWHSPHRTFEVGNRQNTFDLTTATAAPGETVLEKITTKPSHLTPIGHPKHIGEFDQVELEEVIPEPLDPHPFPNGIPVAQFDVFHTMRLLISDDEQEGLHTSLLKPSWVANSPAAPYFNFPLSFNADGTLGAFANSTEISGDAERIYAALKKIVDAIRIPNFDLISQCFITPLGNMRRAAAFAESKEVKTGVGVFGVHLNLVQDVADGVPGALETAVLELGEERWQHFVLAQVRQGKDVGVNVQFRRDFEVMALLQKVEQFKQFPARKQQAVLSYLASPTSEGTARDLHNLGGRIYEKALEGGDMRELIVAYVEEVIRAENRERAMEHLDRSMAEAALISPEPAQRQAETLNDVDTPAKNTASSANIKRYVNRLVLHLKSLSLRFPYRIELPISKRKLTAILTGGVILAAILVAISGGYVHMPSLDSLQIHLPHLMDWMDPSAVHSATVVPPSTPVLPIPDVAHVATNPVLNQIVTLGSDSGTVSAGLQSWLTSHGMNASQVLVVHLDPTQPVNVGQLIADQFNAHSSEAVYKQIFRMPVQYGEAWNQILTQFQQQIGNTDANTIYLPIASAQKIQMLNVVAPTAVKTALTHATGGLHPIANYAGMQAATFLLGLSLFVGKVSDRMRRSQRLTARAA